MSETTHSHDTLPLCAPHVTEIVYTVRALLFGAETAVELGDEVAALKLIEDAQGELIRFARADYDLNAPLPRTRGRFFEFTAERTPEDVRPLSDFTSWASADEDEEVSA